jgi:hypothetical protein
MTRPLITKTGRELIRSFCAYEVVALSVRRTRLSKYVRPLSWWVQRYRRKPFGFVVITGLLTWLVHHLLFDPA